MVNPGIEVPPVRNQVAEPKGATYAVAIGLLYPAALGAALAWLVPAVAMAADTHWREPTSWSILFGCWFVLYHAVWFVYVLQAAERKGFEYARWTFASDIVGIVTIFLAMWALGLATPPPQAIHYMTAYVAVALIPASALIHHRGYRKVVPWLMLLIVFAIALFGGVAHLPGQPSDAGEDWFALSLLAVLLLLYIVVPQLFESSRVENGPKVATGNDSRAGAANSSLTEVV